MSAIGKTKHVTRVVVLKTMISVHNQVDDIVCHHQSVRLKW